MKILIVYATNSGGTAQAVDIAANVLRGKGREVEVKNVTETKPDDLKAYGCVVLASPTWDFADKEGQPHEDFIPFMDAMKKRTYDGLPFAVLGLGDTSYTHYCGVVDIFEELIQVVKGKRIIPSLRIDRFYQKPENTGLVEEWAKQLASACSS
jgi:flavodoxin I